MLSVSLRTIDNLLAAKRLISRKIGRRTLIPRSAIEKLARRDVPSPTNEAATLRRKDSASLSESGNEQPIARSES